METNKMLVYGLLGLVILLAGFTIWNSMPIAQPSSLSQPRQSFNPGQQQVRQTVPSSPLQQAQQTNAKTITTGSTGQGEVEIGLTPLGIKNGRVTFQIAVNTHSVDLTSFDLLQLATFTTAGKTIKPTSAPSLSGHHATDTLSFDATGPLENPTVTITGIPPLATRTYTWEKIE